MEKFSDVARMGESGGVRVFEAVAARAVPSTTPKVGSG